jgi:hypothetical protein
MLEDKAAAAATHCKIIGTNKKEKRGLLLANETFT